MATKKGEQKPKTAGKHKRAICDRMKALGVYRVQYMAAIERLAGLYVQMDEVAQLYREEGGTPVVDHINKAGATNAAMNAHLATMLQLQSQALTHEKELGLTPAALRKLGEAEKKPQKSKIERMLEEMGSG